MENEELVRFALEAREHAYTPYSHWQVGAALLGKNNTVYKGCNIENAAYTPSNCAERTAFFKAVSEGTRDFEAIAIVGGREGENPTEYCAPCGVCRQVMMEFCDYDEFRIILGRISPDTGKIETAVYSLRQLLPEGFGPANLGKSNGI